MRHLKLLLGALLPAVILPVCAYADNSGKPDFDNTSVLVVTKPVYSSFKLQSIDNTDDIFKELGITSVTHVASLPSAGIKSDFSLFSLSAVGDREILKLTLPEAGEDNVLETVDKLNASGAVSYAQPNYYYYLDNFELQSIPDDQLYETSQDSLRVVGAEEVWDYKIDCSNVKIAILDSGLMRDHEDLIDNIWENPYEIAGNGIDDDGNGYIDDKHGWDFTTASSKNNDPTNPVDPYYEPYLYKNQGHGTHVAGIASAVTDNEVGIASLAGNAKLVGIRVFDDYGKSTSEYVCAGIAYAGLIGCDIANCSWGIYNYTDTAMADAITSCPNTLFTCAAGNDSKNIDNSPWKIKPGTYGYDNTICVASSATADTLSSFSNYGTSNVDLAAPGEDAPGVKILSTGNEYLQPNSYIEFMGTSQAAPLVASAAAVLKGRYPSLTPGEIKQYLIAGCDRPSSLSYTDSNNVKRTITGNRRLNAAYSIFLADAELREDAETPVIAVENLEEGGKEISITSATENATIYYTLDGTEPTDQSTLYTDPFVIEKDARIRAVAYKEGMNVSDVGRLNVTFPTVSMPVIAVTETADGYLVTITCETEGTVINYTTDDTLDTEPIPYTAAFTLTEPVTIKAQAYRQYYNDSVVAEYTIIAPTPTPTAEPTEEPSPSPTPVPTASPTPEPTEEPTPSPTVKPTTEPTIEPTSSPTASPTSTPAVTETPSPSPTAGPSPTPVITPAPTDVPYVDILATTVTLTDENGNLVRKNDTPDEIDARITFDNAGASVSDEERERLESIYVIIAVYTEDNRLSGVMTFETGIEKLSSPLTGKITLDGKSRIKKVNLLIWNGIQDMTPLRDIKPIIE